MKKAIFLSDRQVLNDIYVFNLRGYVNVDCHVVRSLDELNTKLKEDKDWDLFISLSNINKVDVAFMVLELRNRDYPELPLIVIGEKTKCSGANDVTLIPANLNIKNLIRAVSRIFDITASQMVELKIGDYYPLPFRILSAFKKAPCPLYVKAKKTSQSEEYIQVMNEGVAIDDRVNSYINQGPKIVYIPSAMRLKIINEVSKNVLETLRREVDLKDTHHVVEQGLEVVAQQLSHEEEVTPELIEISKKCIEHVKTVTNKVPRLAPLLEDMIKNKTGHIYMHTILTSFVSSHIIKSVSWGADEHAEKVRYVLFFHDAYLVPLYNKFPEFKFEEDLLYSGLLSDDEKELVLEHAMLIAEAFKNFPQLPLGADSIVAQHHGMSNGVGFAISYKDDISPLAKVIVIAEEFVNIVLKYREEKGGYDLKEVLRELSSKFSKHTYQKIIHCLADIKL